MHEARHMMRVILMKVSSHPSISQTSERLALTDANKPREQPHAPGSFAQKPHDIWARELFLSPFEDSYGVLREAP